MSGDRPHHRLRAWQLSIDLSEVVYRLTSGFPPEERYGLSAQMRRSSVSIPSNVAEGAARGTVPDYVRFLCFARASLSELETQLEIASRLGFADLQLRLRIDSLARELSAVLNGLIRKLNGKGRP